MYVVKSPRAWTWSVSKLGVNEGNTHILSEDFFSKIKYLKAIQNKFL